MRTQAHMLFKHLPVLAAITLQEQYGMPAPLRRGVPHSIVKFCHFTAIVIDPYASSTFRHDRIPLLEARTRVPCATNKYEFPLDYLIADHAIDQRMGRLAKASTGLSGWCTLVLCCSLV